MKKNKLDIAKNLLSSGELVIFPTETVFGLGADATNDEAVNSIFKVKKRPRSNPIICHFKSIKQIEKYFILNKFEKKLGSKFWPGPLTIILKKKKNSKISKLVSNNSTLVGCRIPGNKLAKKLITLFDLPIAAPSANLSERTSVTNIVDIDPILEKKIFVLNSQILLASQEVVIVLKFINNKIIKNNLKNKSVLLINNKYKNKLIYKNELTNIKIL